MNLQEQRFIEARVGRLESEVAALVDIVRELQARAVEPPVPALEVKRGPGRPRRDGRR